MLNKDICNYFGINGRTASRYAETFDFDELIKVLNSDIELGEKRDYLYSRQGLTHTQLSTIWEKYVVKYHSDKRHFNFQLLNYKEHRPSGNPYAHTYVPHV